MRLNLTEIPTPGNDLWSEARKKIQISLPLGQQDNSNALHPGPSDQSNPRPIPRLPPPPAGLTLESLSMTFMAEGQQEVSLTN